MSQHILDVRLRRWSRRPELGSSIDEVEAAVALLADDLPRRSCGGRYVSTGARSTVRMKVDARSSCS
ncbi:unnamed protein product [Amoebophrya sp. A25]|nr:unnamed protein product [Amoebophrya sp. A25]|eukprot:GSA25T00008944001.1